MAQSDPRVILLDCDMRRPRLHHVFNFEREKGISSYLVGSNSLEEVILRTQLDNLHVIPCGPIPPNPAEILGSNKMRQLLDRLRQDYSRIVIDTPPLTAVTDSVVLAPHTDGVLLVIRAGETPRPLIQNALGQLHSVKAPILGAVLNGVNTGRYGSYYYQYYYYYYGEDGDRKKKETRRRKAQASPY
ncbi:MAG: polysaccharide biosynthesis tyrosine autokinase [Desulfobacteraceae bacterium]|nr:MAG: polysaccharide biosynthesis tyrosine autokinase [Desulfobacteraceae bacterium]